MQRARYGGWGTISASLLFAVVCLWGGFELSLRLSFVNPYPTVCHLVAEKIFLPKEKLEGWQKICLRRSQLVQPTSERKLIIQDINNVLSLLKVSHLEIYDPEASHRIWQGINQETGIESEFVEGELVVFAVHPLSPASKKGIVKGDIIEAINGDQPSPWTAKKNAGDFVVRDKFDKTRKVQLKPRTLRLDESPQVLEIEPKKWIRLKVPSMRSDYFDYKKWDPQVEKILSYQNLILDLRGNRGGSFVAGLRLLAPFICSPQTIGSFKGKTGTSEVKGRLPDILADEQQLKYIEKYQEVLLVTEARRSCFKGKIHVLIDGGTASTAELVAVALREFKQAKIYGTTSAGELLVGVWYPLPELGPEVQISIPEAIYVSHKGLSIEGKGVLADKVLYYDLRQMRQGQDSWVDQVQGGL